MGAVLEKRSNSSLIDSFLVQFQFSSRTQLRVIEARQNPNPRNRQQWPLHRRRPPPTSCSPSTRRRRARSTSIVPSETTSPSTTRSARHRTSRTTWRPSGSTAPTSSANPTRHPPPVATSSRVTIKPSASSRPDSPSPLIRTISIRSPSSGTTPSRTSRRRPSRTFISRKRPFCSIWVPFIVRLGCRLTGPPSTVAGRPRTRSSLRQGRLPS